MEWVEICVNINKMKRAALIIFCSLLGAVTALMALGNSNDQIPAGWVAASPGYILVASVFSNFPDYSDEALWISAIVVNSFLYGIGSHYLFRMVAQHALTSGGSTTINEEPLDTRNGVPLLTHKAGANPVTSEKVKDLLESAGGNERQ